jgi:hypothetical protein
LPSAAGSRSTSRSMSLPSVASPRATGHAASPRGAARSPAARTGCRGSGRRGRPGGRPRGGCRVRGNLWVVIGGEDLGACHDRVGLGLGLAGRVGVRRRRRVRPPARPGRPRRVRALVWWCRVGVPPGAGFGQAHRGAGVGVGGDGQQRRLDEIRWPAAGEGELDRRHQGVAGPPPGRPVQCLPGVAAAFDQGVEVGDAAAGEDVLLPPQPSSCPTVVRGWGEEVLGLLLWVGPHFCGHPPRRPAATQVPRAPGPGHPRPRPRSRPPAGGRRAGELHVRAALPHGPEQRVIRRQWRERWATRTSHPCCTPWPGSPNDPTCTPSSPTSRAPTLVITGDQDTHHPPADAHRSSTTSQAAPTSS